MTQKNSVFTRLPPSYLFPEIARRKNQFLAKQPTAKLINLGIGDTVFPLLKEVSKALSETAIAMGTPEGYRGYGEEQGSYVLREKIAKHFYHNDITPEEIFISDGAKCDIGRLQLLFGNKVKVGFQDPSYPVYAEGSILQGVTELYPLPCVEENGFFPDLQTAPSLDLLYLCNPNNPTGTAFSKEQLEELIAFAHKNRTILLFDSVYSMYVQNDAIFPAIFRLEGAKEVCIDINSFSKIAGFSGLRLGWTVIPKALQFNDKRSVWQDWQRLYATIFNGASSLIQAGSIALFQPNAWQSLKRNIKYYLENAQLLKKSLLQNSYIVYGGENAPYLWVKTKKNSWNAFEDFLTHYHLLTTPGIGYGKCGNYFVRMSAFGYRNQIEAAADRFSSIEALVRDK